MTQLLTITCDTCERDLTTSSNSINYRVLLKSERIPSEGGIVTDMMAYPPIASSLHFCHVKCLKEYVEKNL